MVKNNIDFISALSAISPLIGGAKAVYDANQYRINEIAQQKKNEAEGRDSRGLTREQRKWMHMGQVQDMINQKTGSGSSTKEILPNGDSGASGSDDKLNTGAVDYTYKQGDTFGQVLLDLGLSDPEHLWGEDGDVAYYTKQLNSQGITGNVPIGTTISLLPRKR